MKIAVIGSGYVGLVQSAVMAEHGNKVIGVDINPIKISNLNKGVIPIYEPGLSELMMSLMKRDLLSFQTDSGAAIENSEFIFIAVGTPPGEDGSADLSYVLSVADDIGAHLNSRKIVIVKSTVPVGTCDLVKDRILKKVSETTGCDYVDVLKKHEKTPLFDIVSNPEFLKEGSAVSDCQRPDRIIIGVETEYAENQMRTLYAPFNRNHDKIISMDLRSSEMTKYAANCMLAAKISFMNEMSGIADIVGADIEKVRNGIGADPRIGYHFIYPGCGYGGSCFPKDVKALIQTAVSAGAHSTLLQAIEEVNERQKTVLFLKIKEHFGQESIQGMTFAIWGLSFKPNTDDMREAPSLNVLSSLLASGANLKVYDPEAMTVTRSLFPNDERIMYCDSPEHALTGTDALVICTEWKCFRSPDFEMMSKTLKKKVIFDGRNMYEPSVLSERGITYYAIGRNNKKI